MKNRIFKPINCIDCGIEIIPKSSAQKRCAKCQIQEGRKQGREYEAKKRGGYKLKIIKQCINCGQDFNPLAINQQTCNDIICKSIRHFRQRNTWQIIYKSCVICHSTYICGKHNQHKITCSESCYKKYRYNYQKSDPAKRARKKYKLQNKEKIKAWLKKRNHIYYQRRKQYFRNLVVGLSDSYIKDQIKASIKRTHKIKIDTGAIPNEIIEFETNRLKLIRTFKNKFSLKQNENGNQCKKLERNE